MIHVHHDVMSVYFLRLNFRLCQKQKRLDYIYVCSPRHPTTKAAEFLLAKIGSHILFKTEDLLLLVTIDDTDN